MSLLLHWFLSAFGVNEFVGVNTNRAYLSVERVRMGRGGVFLIKFIQIELNLGNL